MNMNFDHIQLDEKQANLAFQIMMDLCERFYPSEDEFKENIPVLELLYKSAVHIERGNV